MLAEHLGGPGRLLLSARCANADPPQPEGSKARRLIGQLPPEGRRLYELECGHKARRLLDEAVASGEAAKLAEASARYFHTQAGYEATFLLGLYNLDHGLPLAGALSLRRLREAGADADRFEPALTLAMAAGWLEAGAPEEAQRALAALKERQSARSVIVGGREVEWFRDGEETVPWLARLIGPQQTAPGPEEDRWLMFRGDAARNAAGVGSAPLLSLCWRIPVVGDGDGLPEAEVLRQRQQQCRHEGKVVFPALHPLVVGDVVLMRNLRTLLAVDLASGKRLWEVPADDPLDAAEPARTRRAMLLASGLLAVPGPGHADGPAALARRRLRNAQQRRAACLQHRGFAAGERISRQRPRLVQSPGRPRPSHGQAEVERGRPRRPPRPAPGGDLLPRPSLAVAKGGSTRWPKSTMRFGCSSSTPTTATSAGRSS